MKLDSNEIAATDPRLFRSRIFLCIYLGLFLFFIAVGTVTHTRQGPSRRVVFKMNTNGVLSLACFRLTNPTIRHGLFKTIHALGLNVGVAMPQMSGSNFTVSLKTTNFMNTFKEINQAGLFDNSK